jgi:hypothetical protein
MMRTLRTTLFSSLLFATSQFAFAQGGGLPNDDCSDATTLTMTAVCTPVNGTTAGATDSGNPEGDCGGNANDDVWYYVEITGDYAVVRVQGSPGFDAVLEIYDGQDCTDGYYDCANATGGGGTEVIVLTDFMSVPDLLIRVYHAGSSAPSTSTFQICVHGAVPNNDCTGAQSLPMTANCVPVPGDATYTTDDGTVGANVNCQGVILHPDDVWYSFVASGPDAVITVDGGGTATTGYDPMIWLFSGTCGSLLLQACANATGPGATESLVFQGLSVGATYRVMLSNADPFTTPATNTFTICVQQQGGGIGIDEASAVATGWRIVHSAVGTPVELSVDRAIPGTSTLSITDALGREVYQETRPSLGAGRLSLDWTPTVAGPYIIRLAAQGVQIAQKLIAY